jgi:hypothetical protein
LARRHHRFFQECHSLFGIQESSPPIRNLNDRELFQAVMKVQRQPDELGLIAPNAISANLHLVESDLTGLSPGEHVEEPAEPSAVGGSQAVEDPHGPRRCASLTDSRDS